jgi:hypothetical protein
MSNVFSATLGCGGGRIIAITLIDHCRPVLEESSLISSCFVLQVVDRLLLSKHPSAVYLDLLDEDAVPQNADALLIIGQYLSAMDQYQAKYRRKEGSYPYKVKW